MDAVVIEGEADQQRVHAKPRGERLNDGDRRAAADNGSGLAPFLLQRAHRRLEDGSRLVEADRGRASLAHVCDGAIGRERSAIKRCKPSRIWAGCLLGTSLKESLAVACDGMTVLVPGPV